MNNWMTDYRKPMNDVAITATPIMCNIWGGQQQVLLSTWSEIRKLGFTLRQRAFGTLNDGRQALFFMAYQQGTLERRWYVTTETLEQLAEQENK